MTSPIRRLVALVIVGLLLGCERGEQYHDRPLEYWIQALRDTSPQLRAEAVEAIAEASPRSAKTVGILLDALSVESDSSLHPALASALGRLGSTAAPAVPRLITLLSDPHNEIREAAAAALGNIGPSAASAVPALSVTLRDCCHDVRAEAAEALGRIGSPAEASVPALSEALGDPISWVRLKSAEALVAIHSKSLVAFAAFERCLSDAREDVRAECAAGVGQFGDDATSAVPTLARLVTTDPHPIVRIASARALGELGPVSRPALPDLQRAQADVDFDVRRAVRDALGRIGGIQ